jgi:hypothetical protein
MLMPLVAVWIVAAAPPDKPTPRVKLVPTTAYTQRTVQGWPVWVNQRLLAAEQALGDQALLLLEAKLFEIRRALPPTAVKVLATVPIWLGVDDGHAPCAEYHPSREWLERNGYNPDKARCVELGNARRFLDWSVPQPAMVLHELAHGYQDRLPAEAVAELEAAYQQAVKGGKYESVLHIGGKRQRHYALSNAKEYFAESTEALYGTNDFYPFVRAELEQHDPEGYAVVRKLWRRGEAG